MKSRRVDITYHIHAFTCSRHRRLDERGVVSYAGASD
jgi:hypothetical protein